MAQDPASEVSRAPTPIPPPFARGGGYADATEALRSVATWYGNWSKSLADRSVELSYALVAANWAVFGSVDGIVDRNGAKFSIALVIVFLLVNLALSKCLTEMTRRRYEYAEQDAARWQREFEETRGTPTPWPSTRAIDGMARALREARTWLPVLAGLSFLGAIVVPD